MAETTTRSEVSERSSHAETEPSLSALKDGALLEQFVQSRGQLSAADAFAMLVDRHGPMVYRVCRHVLGDSHNAQDAFQATFMVLASQAGSIQKYDSVASWLYGVAYRVANRARVQSLRRRSHEQRYAEATTVNLLEAKDGPAESWEELYQEVASLPEKLRLPVVLCYLEGLTADAAASQLGCPRGTILSRLSRARERLRDRLTRRGLAIPAVLLASGVISQTASAAVPANLSQGVVQAAVMIAAGKTAAQAASAPVATLTQETIKTLFVTKIQTVVATVLLSAGGVTVLATATILAFQPGVLSSRSNNVPASKTELDAICRAWDENASKIVGEITMRVNERRWIEAQFDKVFVSRPSIERAHPRKVTYVRHRKPVETKFVANHQIAADRFRVEKFQELPDRSSRRVLVSTWRPKQWNDTIAPIQDPLLNRSLLQVYGLPYPSTFHYASGFYKYTTLIKERNCTVEKDGTLFKVHAGPAPDRMALQVTYFTFWLDPAKGMMPVRIEQGFLDGPPDVRVENELKQVMPGLWAPVRMTASSMIQDRDSTFLGAVYAEAEHVVDLTASHFGDPPDPSVFTESIPAGVQVIDWIEGTAQNAGQNQTPQQIINPHTIHDQPTPRSMIIGIVVTILITVSGLAIWFHRRKRSISEPNRKTPSPGRTATNHR